MADNVNAPLAATAGPTFATDYISSVHHPYTKVEFGLDGTATIVSSSNGFPVAQQGTWTVGISAAQTIAVTNAGTFVVQASIAAAQTLSTVTTVSTLTSITNVVHVDDNSSTLSIDDGAGSITVDNGGTFAVQATCTNAGTFAVQAVCTNAGTFAVQAVCTNAGTFAVQAAATLAAETTKVIGTVNVAASQTIAVTNTGTFAVQSASTLAAETTKVIGTVNVAAAQTIATTNAGTFAVQPGPATSGGLSVSRAIDLSIANQGSTVAKNGAGQLYGYLITNTNAAVCYFKIYDKATGPTSSDTPVMTVAVPGNAAGAGVAMSNNMGIAFASGISYRCTTAVADNSTAAVAASEVICNVFYK